MMHHGCAVRLFHRPGIIPSYPWLGLSLHLLQQTPAAAPPPVGGAAEAKPTAPASTTRGRVTAEVPACPRASELALAPVVASTLLCICVSLAVHRQPARLRRCPPRAEAAWPAGPSPPSPRASASPRVPGCVGRCVGCARTGCPRGPARGAGASETRPTPRSPVPLRMPGPAAHAQTPPRVVRALLCAHHVRRGRRTRKPHAHALTGGLLWKRKKREMQRNETPCVSAASEICTQHTRIAERTGCVQRAAAGGMVPRQ